MDIGCQERTMIVDLSAMPPLQQVASIELCDDQGAVIGAAAARFEPGIEGGAVLATDDHDGCIVRAWAVRLLDANGRVLLDCPTKLGHMMRLMRGGQHDDSR